MKEKAQILVLGSLLLMLILCSCKATNPSDAIINNAVSDLKGITETIERIDKQTTKDCKTDALLANLEGLRVQTQSIQTQIKNIGLSCTTEKEVLEEKITVRNVIIISLAFLVFLFLYVLIKRRG